jgi:hypothetical protein
MLLTFCFERFRVQGSGFRVQGSGLRTAAGLKSGQYDRKETFGSLKNY